MELDDQLKLVLNYELHFDVNEERWPTRGRIFSRPSFESLCEVTLALHLDLGDHAGDARSVALVPAGAAGGTGCA